MTYITHTRFHTIAICGNVSLPYGTRCESNGTIITLNGKPLCAVTSENAHQYFSIDDDGQGLRRGALVKAIQKRLSKPDAEHQKRWDAIWNDGTLRKFKRNTHADHWLWNQAFFDAPINELERIAALIVAKEE